MMSLRAQFVAVLLIAIDAPHCWGNITGGTLLALLHLCAPVAHKCMSDVGTRPDFKVLPCVLASSSPSAATTLSR